MLIRGPERPRRPAHDVSALTARVPISGRRGAVGRHGEDRTRREGQDSAATEVSSNVNGQRESARPTRSGPRPARRRAGERGRDHSLADLEGHPRARPGRRHRVDLVGHASARPLRPHDGLSPRALELEDPGVLSRKRSSSSETAAAAPPGERCPEPARRLVAHQQVTEPGRPRRSRVPRRPASRSARVRTPVPSPPSVITSASARRARASLAARATTFRVQRHHVPRHDMGHRLRGGQLGQIYARSRARSKAIAPEVTS